jgi:hypothetical protein
VENKRVTDKNILTEREIRCLEHTYLTIARSILLSKTSFEDKGIDTSVIQIIAPGAGEFLFTDIANDIQAQSENYGPSLNLNIVSLPLTRAVFFDAMIAEEEIAGSGNKILTEIILNDNRLGTFDPDLPTLWIDSAITYSTVVYLNHKYLKGVPLGDPAIFVSTNSNNPIEGGRFMSVWSALQIFSYDTGVGFVGVAIEKAFRLPIEKSSLDSNKNATLTYSEKRDSESKYYLGLLWTHSPKNKPRRADLWKAALTHKSAVKEYSSIWNGVSLF